LWSYDRLGNRLQETVAGGAVPVTPPQLTFNQSTNQITKERFNNTDYNFSYDNAGNLTYDRICTYSYDGENRMVQSVCGGVTATYAYDGNGRRVKKATGGTSTIYIFSGSTVIAEKTGGQWKDYLYSGGALLASINGGTTTYWHQDHLSNRIATNSSGVRIGEQGHLPFGEHWYDTLNTKWKFTTYERDAETSLANVDYAINRHYGSRLGRFMQIDPLTGDIADPQTLNRYAYVLNDPTNLMDPLGLDAMASDRQHYVTNPLFGDIGWDCVVDGMPSSCSFLASTGGGAWAQCPQNYCGPSWVTKVEDGQKVWEGWFAFEGYADGSDGYMSLGSADLQEGGYDFALYFVGPKGRPKRPSRLVLMPSGPWCGVRCIGLLRTASNFSAGAGDCLTGRCLFLGTSLTEQIRQTNGADSVVDKNSGAYLGGKITGAAVGAGIASLAAANAALGVESKIALHGAHHTFAWLGGARVAHIQIFMWVAGQKGSDFVNWHIPLPWK
jgi:RHS repeat-associated protein